MVTPDQKAIVESTWATAATLGVETVGVLLFRNIFEIAPGALALFPFKDEPDLYNSPARSQRHYYFSSTE